MKPENVLIDEEGHCVLADFGCSKIIDVEEMNEQLKNFEFDTEEIEDDEVIDFEPDFDDGLKPAKLNHESSIDRKGTFVGTPLYVSPEMLLYNIGCFSSDLWGLGCIIYQCLTGKPPFFAGTANKVFEQILNGEFEIPDYVDSAAQDLIASLLHPDPLKRLGSGEGGSLNDLESLKNHVFFQKSSFKHLPSKQIPKFNLLKLSSKADDEDLDRSFDDLNCDLNNVRL
jgi:3-phosphoinositide dependent protein kinase-1